MPEEAASFISELVLTNPDGTVDKVPILDNQLRLLKSVLQSQFPNFIAAAVNATVAEFNRLVGVTGTLSQLEVVGLYTKQQNISLATLTDEANIAWDLETQQVAQVTLAGNRTLDNPTNIVAGGTYVLFVVQDGTGNRTLTYGTAYKFGDDGAPTLSVAAAKVDVVAFVGAPNGVDILGTYKLGY